MNVDLGFFFFWPEVPKIEGNAIIVQEGFYFNLGILAFVVFVLPNAYWMHHCNNATLKFASSRRIYDESYDKSFTPSTNLMLPRLESQLLLLGFQQICLSRY